MHYLVTGHTGFKGSWLSLMLQMQGHDVSGISLNPPTKSLFVEAELQDTFKYDFRIDIRNKKALSDAVLEINPEIIIHLAAQPLVRESYKFPFETFETNVMGTLNVLEATKLLRNLKAALIITTDKVYKNHNTISGYVETDELGGDDPYSASKSAADIATQSWIKSFATAPMAIARAGNVIGGGDWATDRIIPDLVSAYSVGQLPTLRYPDAVRPWQHVLDCLNGYLKLIDYMLATGKGGEWNFGPQHEEKHTVADLCLAVAREYGIADKAWDLQKGQPRHEAGYLLLNSNEARNSLGWKDNLSFVETVHWTINWYKNYEVWRPRKLTLKQISKFLDL